MTDEQWFVMIAFGLVLGWVFALIHSAVTGRLLWTLVIFFIPPLFLFYPLSGVKDD